MYELSQYFSHSYIEARKRFRKLSGTDQANLLASYDIGQLAPSGEELTIDVARFGSEQAQQLLIISSGTHGVEGFFGSAVQLAVISQKMKQLIQSGNTAVLLIHSVNPFGFAHIRRVNENNIDLNRNGMLREDDFQGADPGYAKLNPMLNPEKPPASLEFFLLRALWNIARHGMPALKNSIAQGQYEFPKGLFFGGKKLSASMQIIQQHLPQWVGQSKKILHLDMHTGLGKRSSYVLASPVDTAIETNQKAAQYFGTDVMQSLQQGKVLYTIRGEFGGFCRSILPDREYLSLLAEFGTYPVLKVIAALRQENQTWHWSDPNSAERIKARTTLKEIFAPAATDWQHSVIQKTFTIVDQAQRYLEE